MVWIHGGSFLYGSKNYQSYGPPPLVSQGVVVVPVDERRCC